MLCPKCKIKCILDQAEKKIGTPQNPIFFTACPQRSIQCGREQERSKSMSGGSSSGGGGGGYSKLDESLQQEVDGEGRKVRTRASRTRTHPAHTHPHMHHAHLCLPQLQATRNTHKHAHAHAHDILVPLTQIFLFRALRKLLLYFPSYFSNGTG